MTWRALGLAFLISLNGAHNAYPDTTTPKILKIQDGVQIVNAPPVSADGSLPSAVNLITDKEFWLSLAVLIFCLAIILFEIHLIKTRQISPNGAIRFVTVTLIISGSLFLITAGFGNNQIAPAFGLLGTIAGYLLGKGSANEST